MTELKTLKDFEIRWEAGNKMVFVDDLKAKAVKWVKFHKTRSDVTITDFLNGWIKHFFNLTEEDLK